MTREELLLELQELRSREARRQRLEAEHNQALRALRERVKELNCLYSITRLAQCEDMSTADLVRGIADVVRDSWQYPEAACAKVSAEGVEYRTEGYRATPWVQGAVVALREEEVGVVEVRYLKPFPDCDEGPFLREERSLINAVADLLGRIVDARRTKAHLRHLSRELIKAQESERQRIARELHDKVAQDLSLIKIGLESLWAQSRTQCPDLNGQAEELMTLAVGAISEIRDLSYALLPPEIDHLGLATSAFHLCEEFADKNDLHLEFFADGMDQVKLDFETQINLYRIIQEGLTNIRKHAQAHKATVRLLSSHPMVILRIEDNGVGFDPRNPLFRDAKDKRMGLWSMRQRVLLLGGRLDIRSAPGGGTRVVVEVPVAREEA